MACVSAGFSRGWPDILILLSFILIVQYIDGLHKDVVFYKQVVYEYVLSTKVSMTDALKGISKFAVDNGPYIRYLYSKQNVQVRVSLEYFIKNVFLVLIVVFVAAQQQFSSANKGTA